MPGRHAARRLLPAPGGPLISRLWPPAAAISSARLAVSCPFTCLRSGPGTASSTSPSCGAESCCVPFRWPSRLTRSGAAITGMPLAHRASAPCAAGQISPHSASLACIAASSTPGEPTIRPSSASSPGNAIGQLLAIDHAHRAEQRERDRQVVMRSVLGQVGRREVNRDPLGRQRKTHRGERGLYPLAALAHRLVRQANDREARQARGELALHLDAAGFEPEIGDRAHQRDHKQALPKERPPRGQPRNVCRVAAGLSSWQSSPAPERVSGLATIFARVMVTRRAARICRCVGKSPSYPH